MKISRGKGMQTKCISNEILQTTKLTEELKGNKYKKIMI